MSKQITTEDKQRIFALYWGQYVLNHNDYIESAVNTSTVNSVSITFPSRGESGDAEYYLLLTPLSDITDEDAIEVAKMTGWLRITGSWRVYKSNFGNTVVKTSGDSFDRYGHFSIESGKLNINQVDYLRSRGYALPAFGWSVNELVAAGVFKLKAKDNE